MEIKENMKPKTIKLIFLNIDGEVETFYTVDRYYLYEAIQSDTEEVFITPMVMKAFTK